MDKSYQPQSDKIASSRFNREVVGDLQEVSELLETGIAHLQPAAEVFAEIYSDQENKKLNLMKAANTIEIDGEKVKTTDFIMTFNELLAATVDKILGAAKNSMRMTLYLNAATKSLDEIKKVIVDHPAAKNLKKDIHAYVSQIEVDLETCEDVLKDLVCMDINETLEMQAKLSQSLDAFSRRNMQLMQMTGNPPLSTRLMEEALMNVANELKNSRLAKYRIEKLITKLNDTGN